MCWMNGRQESKPCLRVMHYEYFSLPWPPVHGPGVGVVCKLREVPSVYVGFLVRSIAA